MSKRKRQPDNFARDESGLWLPRHGLVGPDRTRFDSRRFMPGYPCCCESCTIFEDDFSTDDLADKWTDQSGTWSIGSGVLSTSSSNAVLTCDTTYPGGGFHNHVVQVSLKASTGDRSRIIFSYDSSDSSYNYVEVYWNGASSYIYIKTSAGVTAATSGEEDFTDGNTYVFKICITSTSATIEVASACVVIGSIDSTTTNVGVGTGATSNALLFDSFLYSRHVSEMDGCPDCSQPCQYCNGNQSAEISVSISGVTDYGTGYPSHCDTPCCESAMNGTFIFKMECEECSVYDSFSGVCCSCDEGESSHTGFNLYWCYNEFSANNCFYGGQLGHYYFVLSLATMICHTQATSPLCAMSYFAYDFGTDKPDCNALYTEKTLSLVRSCDDGYACCVCDFSSAVVKVQYI